MLIHWGLCFLQWHPCLPQKWPFSEKHLWTSCSRLSFRLGNGLPTWFVLQRTRSLLLYVKNIQKKSTRIHFFHAVLKFIYPFIVVMAMCRPHFLRIKKYHHLIGKNHENYVKFVFLCSENIHSILRFQNDVILTWFENWYYPKSQLLIIVVLCRCSFNWS